MKISALATLLFAANAATTHAAETKQHVRKAEGEAEKLAEAIEVRLMLRVRSIIVHLVLHIVFYIIHIIYHISLLTSILYHLSWPINHQHRKIGSQAGVSHIHVHTRASVLDPSTQLDRSVPSFQLFRPTLTSLEPRWEPMEQVFSVLGKGAPTILDHTHWKLRQFPPPLEFQILSVSPWIWLLLNRRKHPMVTAAFRGAIHCLTPQSMVVREDPIPRSHSKEL